MQSVYTVLWQNNKIGKYSIIYIQTNWFSYDLESLIQQMFLMLL